MSSLSRLMTVVVSLITVLILSVSSVFAANADWSVNNYIEVTGQGMAPPNSMNAIHGRMMARRAAIADGYRQLAEIVKGVQVESGTDVEMMMLQSDQVRLSVSATIKGATIVSENDLDGGGYEVTMRVPIFGVSNSLAKAVIPKPTVIEPLPAPVPEVIPSVPAGSLQGGTIIYTTIDDVNSSSAKAIGGYTGVIIDCRSLGLNPVMSPVIKNERGISIYGHKNLNYDKVVADGMVGYATSVNQATRAGSNPLIIKAISLTDHNANPVISVADANRMLIENGSSNFLNDTKVVFLR